MAGQITDPRALGSWEDAFQYPLPVVRKLEQQLRKNIDDNRSKLRSLVGASYRDLLGTAERIIEMDQQMETVESNLGDIGRGCNARTVERIAENGARMRKSLNARDGDKHSAMAQTKVLQSALTMVLRTVKSGGDALRASKLLVLSRLLFKSVSEGGHTPPILEDVRKKLATLRKRLLSYITAAMVKTSEDKNWQVNVLCAYALVTSSTPKDVLRHFLQVRYEQLDGRSDSSSESDILSMLDLYSQTLLDTRDLFPRRLSETLMQLAKSPLIRDEQVQSAYELNLDIYNQWIAEDVRTFTPWVRYDQLGSKEVADALEAWSKQAQACLLRGVEEFLRDHDDAATVASMRRKVISKYMSLSGKMRNGEHSQTIHGIRDIFLRKLQELAIRTASFGDMTFDVSVVSSETQADVGPRSMWDLATENMDLSQGALKFRRSIVQTRNSRTAPIQAAGKRLDDWIARIDVMLNLVDHMRTDKWDDSLELDLDDIEESDVLVQTLTKHDPDKLQDSLRDAAETTLQALGSKLTSDAAPEYSASYIRIWREVGQRHRALSNRLLIHLNKVSLATLQESLVRSILGVSIEVYIKSAHKQCYVALELWDGSPPVPVQPSPAVFRFLKSLHEAMSAAGSDLWSPHATQELKRQVSLSLSTKLRQESFTKLTANTSLANGHSGDDDDGTGESETLTNGVDSIHNARKHWLWQNLFDVQYLHRIFNFRVQDGSKGVNLTGVAEAISTELDLDEASKERLEKSANEYWRRTYLLFGLLAPN